MKAAAMCAIALMLAGCKAGPRVVVQEQDEAPLPQAAAAAPGWDYKADGRTSWACVPSADNAAELCFRRANGHLDSYMHLRAREGNPFFCQRGRCETKLKLDAGADETVQGTDDEYGGTRILFLPAPEKLLQEVRQAKELRVKPPMFGVDQEFVFEVAGLNWK